MTNEVKTMSYVINNPPVIPIFIGGMVVWLPFPVMGGLLVFWSHLSAFLFYKAVHVQSLLVLWTRWTPRSKWTSREYQRGKSAKDSITDWTYWAKCTFGDPQNGLNPLAGIYAHNLVHIYLHCNLYNLDIHINGSENIDKNRVCLKIGYPVPKSYRVYPYLYSMFIHYTYTQYL